MLDRYLSTWPSLFSENEAHPRAHNEMLAVSLGGKDDCKLNLLTKNKNESWTRPKECVLEDHQNDERYAGLWMCLVKIGDLYRLESDQGRSNAPVSEWNKGEWEAEKLKLFRSSIHARIHILIAWGPGAITAWHTWSAISIRIRCVMLSASAWNQCLTPRQVTGEWPYWSDEPDKMNWNWTRIILSDSDPRFKITGSSNSRMLTCPLKADRR
jgi:hypothetical protein